MSSSGWGNFWENQNDGFHAPMKLSTLAFAGRIDQAFHLKETDEILDYGCGPGFLADCLTPRQIKVTGAEINSSFIKECKKNHPNALFIQITTDVHENQKIFESQLNEKRFDFIVLLSIVQYFENISAVEEVVGMLEKYLNEKGKIIIADVIDQNTSPMRDAISLFIQCVKKGKPLIFFRFIFYLLFSNYRTLSKNVKLLTISPHEMNRIAHKNSLSCDKINGLTIHSSRTSYVLCKKKRESWNPE